MSFPAANNLVGRMAEAGIVQEITGQRRNRRFMYEEYIALFYDEPLVGGT